MARHRSGRIIVVLFALVALLPALGAAAQQPSAAPPQAQGTASPFPPPPVPPAALQAASSESAAAPQSEAAQPTEPPSRLINIGRPDRELSPWTMFLSADILVKAVMVSLAFASMVTWTILLAKTIQIGLARRRLTSAMARVSGARSLAEAQIALGPERGLLPDFLKTAIQELRLSADALVETSVKERVATSLAELTKIEARSVRQGLAVLATIGSTAPFVGLFGTVWGIMNSFIGISKAQTTNLAVVAPGIAEALLATAIGLVAAIPAVMIYNHFSRVTKGYVDQVGRASGEVGRLLSRDLDRAQGRVLARAAE